MRIDILEKDGRDCPTVFCDVCLKRIEDAGMAIAKWREKAEGDPTWGKNHVVICHKGKCDKDPTYPQEAYLFCQELDVFLTYLSQNANINEKSAKARAVALSSI